VIALGKGIVYMVSLGNNNHAGRYKEGTMQLKRCMFLHAFNLRVLVAALGSIDRWEASVCKNSLDLGMLKLVLAGSW
jgi:hypothetical protein